MNFPDVGASGGGLKSRIAAFEAAAAEAADPKHMAAKISEFSDRKKYNFASGLQHDVVATREAMKAVSKDGKKCMFGQVYEFTDGQIANLNRVLQNLKKAGEISFENEVFYQGQDDLAEITFLQPFFDEMYKVDGDNCFRPGRNMRDVPEDERLGRSYVQENLDTCGVTKCFECGEEVGDQERLLSGIMFSISIALNADSAIVNREKSTTLLHLMGQLCAVQNVSSYMMQRTCAKPEDSSVNVNL
eukprot:CAMPEP_0203784920 /NCGR_PEP_ID=MMETSP0100_2-20121128/737_1 /ASSEMBLY_ACC=CAM_ASM_000210 /TAXON_ID=96639 /ORGANISM=" , Strain NY0313808BC1" /LENGTH=244 /DNA_ID=CAMNT_0050686961 /DNA_START=653 /DNA_END=1388 /DNA_ORIENTATION=+